jgi:WD40 repeat protein
MDLSLNLPSKSRPLSDTYCSAPLDPDPLLPAAMRNQILRKPTPPKFHTRIIRQHQKKFVPYERTVNLADSLLNDFNSLSITKTIKKDKRSKPFQQWQIKRLLNKPSKAFNQQVKKEQIESIPLILPLQPLNYIKCQRIQHIVTDSSYVADLILLKDGRLVSSDSTHALKVWKHDFQECEAILETQKEPVQGVIQLNDGYLMSFSLEGSFKFWNIQQTNSIKTVEYHKLKTSFFSCIELQDGRLAFGSLNKIIVWDRLDDQWSTILSIKNIGGIYCCTQLANGNLIMSAEASHHLHIWDLNNKWLKPLKGHTDTVYMCIQLQNGNLISASKDNTLKIWDAEKGSCLLTLEGHEEPVRSCIQLKNGYLVSASEDGTLKIWCSHTGVCLATLEGHLDAVVACVQLENGLLASASSDGTIKTWLIGP